MFGIKVFTGRGICLAAVVVSLFVAEVWAGSPYVISAVTGANRFSVKQNGYDVKEAQNVSMDSALAVIRKAARGDSVEIRFDTTDGGVLIDWRGIRIAQDSMVVPRWGVVTLSGAIQRIEREVSGYALSLNGGYGKIPLNVTSSLNITAEGTRGGIFVDGYTNLSVDSCEISATRWDAIAASGASSKVTISGGKFTSKGGSAVSVSSGTLEISGGTFESEAMGTILAYGPTKITGGRFVNTKNSVLMCYNDNIDITGGSFTATEGGTALYVVKGKVCISGDASFSTLGSDSSATVLIRGDAIVELAGGTIVNEQNKYIDPNAPTGRAVNIAYTRGKLVITGDTPPDIKGSILFLAPKAIELKTDRSWRYSGKYVLEPRGSVRVDGVVAVVGGGEYIDNFKYDNKIYELKKRYGDIVVKLRSGIEPMSYTIMGDTVSGFIAVVRGTADTIGLKESLDFETLFGRVRVHAGGKPCSLYLGKGLVPLDIGGNRFSGTLTFLGGETEDWGRVTLLGGFICRRTQNLSARHPTCGLSVSHGVSLENYANITSVGHNADVFVSSGSDYTHMAGTLSLPIFNGQDNLDSDGGIVKVIGGKVSQIVSRGADASVIVTGGTVGDTTSYKYAIRNYLNGEVVISDSAIIVSADTSVDGGTVINEGTLVINGVRVSNVKASKNGTSIAINNNYNGNDTAVHPNINILGPADISSKSSDNNGVICNRKGEITIFDGDVYNTADTVGAVIANYGKLTIGGTAYIESQSRYSSYKNKGTIYSSSVEGAGYESALNIIGGTVKAKDGFAVYSDEGGVTVLGDAQIVSADSAGAIYIGSNGYLKLFGGKVSSTWKESNRGEKLAIEISSGGDRGGDPGRLEMGGSPIVDGIILLLGLDSIPITVLATEDDEYPFNPDGETYHIMGHVNNGHVVLKNGAKFIHDFVLDTTGNAAGLTLAVNGNDVFATTGRVYSVDFSLNGSTEGEPPAAIPVMDGGTIGDLAKPSTKEYWKMKDNYGFTSDGEWYIRSIVDNVEHAGEVFEFGVGSDGTPVKEKLTLILSWVTDSVPLVSVKEAARDLPPAGIYESVTISPIVSSSNGLTVGPNPISNSYGAISFFRSGVTLKDGKLFVYDAAGNVVAKIVISDNDINANKRSVAKWNLQDTKGRKVAEGTYVAKGVVTTKTGKNEKVSVPINVQR